MHLKRQMWSLGCFVYGLILVASILSADATAATYYISPAGSDSQSGTSSSTSWRTFSFAIPKLHPGDTLLLLDGTYTIANSGMPQFTCGKKVNNGTASQPITMKAQNERKAHIQSDGTRVTLALKQCAYWVIEGIYLSSADNPTNYNKDGSVIAITSSNHLTLRRLLVTNANRYLNSQGIRLAYTHHSLLEENEIYFIHRHGISLFGSSGPTVPSHNMLRRNYLHSRNYKIAGGPARGGSSIRGDSGISCYPCNNTIFENNIAEDWAAGFDIQAKSNAINNQYLGDIALNNDGGFVFRARPDFPPQTVNTMPQNTTLRNVLSYKSGRMGGAFWRATKNTQCHNCSFLDGGNDGAGIKADIESTISGDGHPTIAGTNILIANTAGAGFYIVEQFSWSLHAVMLYNNTGKNVPALPGRHLTNVSTANPALGACKVFIPAGSPAKGAGVGGADIGANILYRYQDGVLTTTPLWNPTTGQFPCGAQVAGVNDLAGSSCFDVHERLNVHTNGCMLPPLDLP